MFHTDHEATRAVSNIRSRETSCCHLYRERVRENEELLALMTATSAAGRSKTRFSSRNLSAVYRAPLAQASDYAGELGVTKRTFG